MITHAPAKPSPVAPGRVFPVASARQPQQSVCITDDLQWDMGKQVVINRATGEEIPVGPLFHARVSSVSSDRIAVNVVSIEFEARAGRQTAKLKETGQSHELRVAEPLAEGDTLLILQQPGEPVWFAVKIESQD